MLKDNIKYEDIDASFLDFKPSNNLPLYIKNIVNKCLDRNKVNYISYGNAKNNYDIYLSVDSIYYFTKFSKVFTSDADELWNSLYTQDDERAVKLAKYFVNIYTHIGTLHNTYKNRPDKLNNITLLLNKMEDTLECMGLLDNDIIIDEGWEYLDKEAKESVISIYPHEELQLNLLEYMDNLRLIKSKMLSVKEINKIKEKYPVSRKRNAENAEAVLFIKSINSCMRSIYNKPYHKYVATFINLVFDTDYVYSDIAQIVRKR